MADDTTGPRFNLGIDQGNYDSAAGRVMPAIFGVLEDQLDLPDTKRGLVVAALIAAFNEGMKFQGVEMLAQIDEQLEAMRAAGAADGSYVSMGRFEIDGLDEFLVMYGPTRG